MGQEQSGKSEVSGASNCQSLALADLLFAPSSLLFALNK